MSEGQWRVIAEAPLYEINPAGVVRNVKSGRTLVPYGPSRMYRLTLDKYYHIGRSTERLLKETFGD